MSVNNNPEKKASDKIITIPNILSLIRLLLIPVFLWFYIREQNYSLAAVVIIFSGFSDVLDGFIARRFKQVTNLGKVLDPIADKITQFDVLVCLLSRFDYMLAPLLLLVIKEIALFTFGLVLYRKNKCLIGALWHGKLAAMALYFMLFVHLVWDLIWTKIPDSVSLVTFTVAITLMLMSLFLYIKKYVELLTRDEVNKITE